MIYLSDRQAEVLKLLKEGKSKGQIATTLGISKSVAKDHVQRLTQLGMTFFKGSKRHFSTQPFEVVDNIKLSIAYGCMAMIQDK